MGRGRGGTLLAAALALLPLFPGSGLVAAGNKKLVFIHHSVGGQLLADSYGGLGRLLKDSGFFVSDICYGWDAPENRDIGNDTDIGQWHAWFADVAPQANGVPRRDNIMAAVYAESGRSGQFGAYARGRDPGGENEIVMIKSCYPNSNLHASGADSIFGCHHDWKRYTVDNCRAVYRAILPYFRLHPEKMFIVITAPSRPMNITPEEAANARRFNNWLVGGWLRESGRRAGNVFVWDYFNVLTGRDNHHRAVDGRVVHETAAGSGDLTIPAYHSDGDEHPNPAAAAKGAAELHSCLLVWYQLWKDGGGSPCRGGGGCPVAKPPR